jgi:hypothetical protein
MYLLRRRQETLSRVIRPIALLDRKSAQLKKERRGARRTHEE